MRRKSALSKDNETKPGLVSKRSRRRGFTLTEVVVASTLLIVAMVPILKGLTSVHFTAASVERRTRSIVLAQAKLDEIRARSIYNYGQTFKGFNQSLDGAYLCLVKDTSVSPNLRMIMVGVGYDINRDNKLVADEVLVTLSTLIARRW